MSSGRTIVESCWRAGGFGWSSEEQADFAERIAGACRAVWNCRLQQRREYSRRSAWMNYRRQAHELAEAKTEHPWLAEAPSHCLQQMLMDLDRACRTHGTLAVRWRSSRRWRPSFRFPDGKRIAVEPLNHRHARVKLPKLGWVRFRLSRPLDGARIRSATLRREWALVRVVACGRRDDDTTGARCAWYRCGSGSRGRGGRGDQRWSAGGPGFPKRRGASPANEAAATAVSFGQAWPQPRQDTCRNRCDPRAGTSPSSGLLCLHRPQVGDRGRVDPRSRESQAVFRCTHCSHTEHAGDNGAKNILAAGLAVTACGDPSQPSGWGGSLKKEPAGNREELLL
jgi:hypothetical protein